MNETPPPVNPNETLPGLPTRHQLARHYMLAGLDFGLKSAVVDVRTVVAPALLMGLATSADAEALVFVLNTLLSELRARVFDSEREMLNATALGPVDGREPAINAARFKVRHSRTAVRLAEAFLVRATELHVFWAADFDAKWLKTVESIDAVTDEEIRKAGAPPPS